MVYERQTLFLVSPHRLDRRPMAAIVAPVRLGGIYELR